MSLEWHSTLPCAKFSSNGKLLSKGWEECVMVVPMMHFCRPACTAEKSYIVLRPVSLLGRLEIPYIGLINGLCRWNMINSSPKDNTSFHAETL